MNPHVFKPKREEMERFDRIPFEKDGIVIRARENIRGDETRDDRDIP